MGAPLVGLNCSMVLGQSRKYLHQNKTKLPSQHDHLKLEEVKFGGLVRLLIKKDAYYPSNLTRYFDQMIDLKIRIWYYKVKLAWRSIP